MDWSSFKGLEYKDWYISWMNKEISSAAKSQRKEARTHTRATKKPLKYYT